MDFNTFVNELSTFVENKEINNKDEFLNLALFRFIKESGLNEHMKVNIGKNQSGETCVFQLERTNVISSFHLRDSKASDSNSYIPLKYAGHFVLHTVHSNENVENFLDDNKKKRLIKVYNQILNSPTLSDLLNAVSEGEDLFPLKDQNVNELSRFLEEYDTVKDQIKDQNYNQKNLGKLFTTLLSIYTKFNAGNFLQIGHAADKFLGEVVFDRHEEIPMKFLVDGNVSNIIGLNKHIEMTQEKMDNLFFDDTLIGTISKAIKNKTGSKLIDDIYDQHIKPHYEQHFSLALRMLNRQSTLENKLDNPLLNQFMTELKFKYPAAFNEEPLHSFKSTIYQSSMKKDDDTYPTLNKKDLFDVLNKFNLIDNDIIAKSSSIYNDITHLKSNKLFTLNRGPDEIRFVGETEMGVKYIISGEVQNISVVGNDSIKALNVSSMIMLNKSSIYNEMAIEQLFKYCKDNNLALVNKVEVDQYESLSDGSRANYSVFSKTAEAYKDNVYVVEAYNQKTRFELLKNTTLDLQTFNKYSNRIHTECLKSLHHLEKLKEIETTIKSQQIKNKI